jgi:predicted nucleic acid-binding protein
MLGRSTGKMSLSGGRARDMRATLARLLAVLALFTACALPAVAQSGASPDKKAEVKRLLKVTGVREDSAEIFKELVSRYQKRWPDAVLADYRKKGLFKPLTPDETEQMEFFKERTFEILKDAEPRMKAARQRGN